MTRTRGPRRRSTRASALLALALVMGLAAPTSAAALLTAADAGDSTSAGATPKTWSWPLTSSRVAVPYAAPAHEYAPGHRGLDLRPLDDGPVRAPAGGTVAFAGEVAGRGVLTLDHGDGYVTTLEPVTTDLSPGTVVSRGDPVGALSVGGHAEPGTLHFGVRLHGEYINPLVLLGGIPRAVLLPCC